MHWLFRTYSEREIKEAVLESRGFSPKTARCWQNYFGLREEEMRCFGTALALMLGHRKSIDFDWLKEFFLGTQKKLLKITAMAY
ncbi:MAG: hypothetical protein AB1523_06705 [Bacillota bacterium]